MLVAGRRDARSSLSKMAHIGRVTRSVTKDVPSAHIRRIHGAFVVLAYATLPSGGARFTCVVSKKTARLAKDRNRIKRRVRAIVREVLAKFDAPLLLIFNAKPPAKTASGAALREEIAGIMGRVAR